MGTDRTAAHGIPWLLVVGIVLLALNLRGPIVAPAPVIGDIRADLGLSTAAAGLLTGLPVFFFAVATPLASWVIRRAGPEMAVIGGLLGVLAGTVLRSVGSAPLVILGTAVIGIAITVGNIVVPVLIRRDVPWRQASAVTGAYTAALNIGSMITSVGTAPIAAAVGWRWALATWGLLAVVGAGFWVMLTRRSRAAAVPAVATSSPGGAAVTGAVARIGWLLMAAFAGQAFAYYAVTTWLPTLLADGPGLDANTSGLIASIFQVSAVVGAFGVPVLASRFRPWVPVATIGALWITMPLGLLLAPSAYVLWALIGGVAQGGGYTAILTIMARVATSDRETAAVSARVQAGGYVAATAAAPLVGALYSATGGWTAGLGAVLLAAITFTIAGLLAALLVPRR